MNLVLFGTFDQGLQTKAGEPDVVRSFPHVTDQQARDGVEAFKGNIAFLLIEPSDGSCNFLPIFNDEIFERVGLRFQLSDVGHVRCYGLINQSNEYTFFDWGVWTSFHMIEPIGGDTHSEAVGGCKSKNRIAFV